MRLSHLHIPKPIAYAHSLRLQEALLDKHFRYKDQVRKLQRTSSTAPTITTTTTAPNPTLLTFQTHPTYTVGRRHLHANPLSDTQIRFLTTSDNDLAFTNRPTFHASPRGGLLTYHAPGQLTAYLILDLRRHTLTPRCYIRLLEETIIRLCGAYGVPNATTTHDPGVWVGDTGRKICAVGVQVSRGVTSHGIGLNVVDTPIEPQKKDSCDNAADTCSRAGLGYLSWGFGRIVACGLEGKTVTWLAREAGRVRDASAAGLSDLTVDRVSESLAVEVARSLDIDEGAIDAVSEEEVLREE